jgi:dCTP deaminase
MILTDREIQVALATNQIQIEPAPAADAYSSTSIDLTLGSRTRVWGREVAGVSRVFSPADPDFQYRIVVEEMAVQQEMGADGIILGPREFVLAWTTESVSLPIRSRLAARVEGKSSLARLGIGVHVTAPTIHAGFEGQIQLEIYNHGTLRVRLVPTMPVCQLIFEQTFGTPDQGYQGQFQRQVAG